MRSPRPNKKSSAFDLALVTLAFAVAIFAAWRMSESKPRQNLPAKPAVFTKSPNYPPPTGYTRFDIEESYISFVYPLEVNPVKLNPTPPVGSMTSLNTRYFNINVWPSAEFIYSKNRGGKINCIYDGALQTFSYEEAGQSGGKTDCNLSVVQFGDAEFYDGSYEHAGKHVYSYLGLIKNRQYFLEIRTTYNSECFNNPSIHFSVCRARADYQKSRLINFVNDFAANNTTLFLSQ